MVGPAWGLREPLDQRGPQLRHHRGRRLRAGSSRSGSSRASPASTCWRSIRAASGPTPASATSCTKNEETYRNVFTIHYPDEERPDARPAKTSPVYDKLKHMGAVFGQRYGWERANWFAPAGVEAKDEWSFRRTNYFEHVGNECRRLRERVGVIDLTPVHQARCRRPGRRGLARRPRREQGAGEGRPHGALPRADEARRHPLRVHDHEARRGALLRRERGRRRALRHRLPAQAPAGRRLGRASQTSRRAAAASSSRVRARATCSRSSPTRRSTTSAFPWLTGQVAEVGLATDVYLLRVNFVGALGWELHFPIEYAHHLFVAIFTAGAEHGIGMAGMRAMESLRMEKSYRMWGSDLTRENTPFEAGLDRFVRMGKGEFIGKEALEAARRRRAQPLRHARSPRRHRRRPARQRTAVRPEGRDGRPRDLRLLRTRAEEEPRDRLREDAVFEPSARRCRSRSSASGKKATVLVDSPYDPENRDLRA